MKFNRYVASRSLSGREESLLYFRGLPGIVRKSTLAALFLVATAAFASNAIQLENAKTGTSSWQISNPAENHEIEGYADLTSVPRGKSIKLMVSTTDHNFTINIYRMGWYGGLGARLMTGPLSFNGHHQSTPHPDNNGMVDCNWSSAYTLSVPKTSDPTNWCSGVYLALLTGTQSGKQSYIMFVVRDDNSTSDYLFTSSVTTMQAYNFFGGQSLYPFNAIPKAVKVSFDRPYLNGDGAAEFLTGGDQFSLGGGWEYCMVRFLEREGYDVSYCTSIDIDQDANHSMMTSHKAYFSVGHDEYWSLAMRRNVEAARDAGVSLGFFSSNVCFWQIRFENNDRRIVCYKQTAFTNDPYATDHGNSNNQQITTEWRLNPAVTPESSFIGVEYFFYPVVQADFVCSDVSNWIYAGTLVNNGDLLPGLVGYEADAACATSPSNIHVVGHSYLPPSDALWAEGLASGGYSDMTTYVASSGATVVATGTMQWSWGLDDWGVPNEPGRGVSHLSWTAGQMTRNILARFAGKPVGVIPGASGTIN